MGKGISPIIASVLLLAVTLTVVGVFSGWAPNVVQSVTDETENSTMQTIECNEAGMELRSVYYNTGGNYALVTVRNRGPVNLSDVVIAAWDSEDRLIKQKGNLVYSAENPINETNITGIDSEPSYLEGYSSKCSDVEDRLDDINT